MVAPGSLMPEIVGVSFVSPLPLVNVDTDKAIVRPEVTGVGSAIDGTTVKLPPVELSPQIHEDSPEQNALRHTFPPVNWVTQTSPPGQSKLSAHVCPQALNI